MGERVKGFTLIELVTVIALVSMFLLFLVKLNITGSNEGQQVRATALILASSFDGARGQAIAGNTYAKIFFDTSSDLKFRRMAVIKQTQNVWKTEREILLPERTFVLSPSNLAECLDNANLSAYPYPEESAILQGEDVDGYCFTFTPEGCLFHGAAAILGIGYGTKVGDDIKIKQDTNIYGLLVTTMGKGVTLESKNAIKGAI
jgi:prepilin-type N-terminal cleavage/methylation domain-containing protein